MHLREFASTPCVILGAQRTCLLLSFRFAPSRLLGTVAASVHVEILACGIIKLALSYWLDCQLGEDCQIVRDTQTIHRRVQSLCVRYGSLPGITVRPVPCNDHVIEYTTPFHGANADSNPAGDANSISLV